MKSILIVHPIRTQSEANLREHWGARHRRSRIQRATAKMLVRQYPHLRRHTGDYIITLTRVAPRRLDDDNLARSFKAIRDGVADAIGVDDGAERFTWCYAQENGRPKQYAVKIQIEAHGPKEGK